MRILVIGGSGKVGSVVLPYLTQKYSITVFDLSPPTTPDVAYIAGDVGDYDALRAACAGQEALLYMAMGQGQLWNRDPGIAGPACASAFDVNTRGVYLALRAAHENGITQAIYTSSMSVYRSIDRSFGEKRYFTDEDLPPDAIHPYGLTKRLGEEVCHNAAREWDMDVNVLRLCFPIADEEWYEKAVAGEPTIRTAASDVARIFDAALTFQGGFQAFMVSGDYEQKIMSMAKARKLLQWEPLARPK